MYKFELYNVYDIKEFLKKILIVFFFRADELRQKFDLEMAAYKQTAHHY